MTNRPDRRRPQAHAHAPLEIDEHVVVACTPADAAQLFAGPLAVMSWFGVRRQGDRAELPPWAGLLDVRVTHEQWLASDLALLIDGVVDGLPCRSHITLRAVVAPRAGDPMAAGTEIWVHVELERGADVEHIASRVASVVHRGLAHIRSEIDCRPEAMDR